VLKEESKTERKQTNKNNETLSSWYNRALWRPHPGQHAPGKNRRSVG